MTTETVGVMRSTPSRTDRRLSRCRSDTSRSPPAECDRRIPHRTASSGRTSPVRANRRPVQWPSGGPRRWIREGIALEPDCRDRVVRALAISYRNARAGDEEGSADATCEGQAEMMPACRPVTLRPPPPCTRRSSVRSCLGAGFPRLRCPSPAGDQRQRRCFEIPHIDPRRDPAPAACADADLLAGVRIRLPTVLATALISVEHVEKREFIVLRQMPQFAVHLLTAIFFAVDPDCGRTGSSIEHDAW